MPQIFGCPYCQSPFGVPDSAAGQTFECPNCNKPVEVPGLNAAEPEVYRCPHCEGEFAIDSSMYGQQLACPHCENHVAIGEQPESSPPPPRVEEETFDIVIEGGPGPVAPPAPEQQPGKRLPSKKKTREKKTREKEPAGQPPRGKQPAGKTGPTEVVPKRASKPKAENGRAGQGAASRPKLPSVETHSALTGSATAAPKVVQDSKANSRLTKSSSLSSLAGAQSVAHLLPPTFDVLDPVRFPRKIGANEVLLPDGHGGYQTAEANVVTITYHGKVYHLQRMTPEERRKRRLIHNVIAISIAVLLIFLTLQAIGLFS